MKKINLIERLLSYSHEKQSPQRFARYAAMLIMLLTLGVGQMWADKATIDGAYIKYSYSGTTGSGDISSSTIALGTLTENFVITDVYLKLRQDWSSGYKWSNGFLKYDINNQNTWPTIGADGWNCVWKKDISDDGYTKQYELQQENVSWTFSNVNGASGNYTMKYLFQVYGNNQGDGYLNNGGSNYTITWSIAPPNVSSSYTVSINNRVDGDTGDGTEANPYVITWGVNPTISVSGATKAHTDENSSIQYKFGSADWGTGTSTTVNPSTSKASITIQTRCYNSTASLASASTTDKTIWYQWEDPYTINVQTDGSGMGTVSPSTVYTKGDVASASFTASVAVADAAKYEFVDWSATSGVTLQSSASSATNTVKATANGTVTANFRARNYSITYDPAVASNCTYTTTPASAAYGSTVNLTITPEENYTISSVTAVDASSNTVTVSNPSTDNYSFTMPASNVTVTVETALSSMTVTLDADETNHGSLDGITESQTYAYGDATTTVNVLPPGADGYKFMGYYTETGGGGTKLINADGTWIANVDGYTDGSTNWIHGSDVMLYAYYQAATITSLALPGGSLYTVGGSAFTANATVSAFDGNALVCWQVKNDSEEEVSTTFTPASGNSVTVSIPSTPGSYKVVASLKAGTTCSGDVLHTAQQSFTVQGNYTVSITNGTGSSSVGEVTTATATANAAAAGMKFDHWTVVSGTMTSGDVNSRTITFTASSNITLTAVYTERDTKKVYFAKPSSWEKVYAYAWEDGNATNKNGEWAATAITSNTETIKGTTYHYYEYYIDDNGETGGDKTNQDAWDRIIFHQGTSPGTAQSTKTADLTLVDGYFYHIADGSGENGRSTATVSGSASAEDWYVCGYWNQSTDDWGFAHPVDLNGSTTGNVVVTVTASRTQEFKIYRASTNEWFKWTGGPSADYYDNYAALIGEPMTLRIYNANRNTFTSYATEYLFTLDITSTSNPVLTLVPNENTPYSATLSKNGHGSLSVGTGAITLKQYIPTTITATPEPGYRFTGWTTTGSVAYAGGTSLSSTTAMFTATDNGGTITANFSNSNIIYFDRSAVNGVWSGSDVYVTFFTNNSHWEQFDDDRYGKGERVKMTNYVSTLHNLKMNRIPNTEIYYLYTGGAATQWYMFTDKDMPADNQTTWEQAAVAREDFSSSSGCNMFVVENYVDKTVANTGYYYGYWMKYHEEDPGVQLCIYSSGSSDHISESPFTLTTEEIGSTEFTKSVHLSAATTYAIELHGLNGIYYKNKGTMTSKGSSGWEYVEREATRGHITTTAEGDYKFTLSCANQLILSAEYPLDVNDFQIVFNGKVKTTDGSNKIHPSRVIRHLTEAGTQKDTISFFVIKGNDWSLQIQKCNRVNPTITWENVGSAISPAAFGNPATGVYNFVVEQTHDGSSNSVSINTKVEKYDGHFYIRSDAAKGGWEGYKKALDNQMIYSNFSRLHSDFDYYHCSYRYSGNNVKFTIANDYSSCVSDTTENDAYVTSYGNLPADASVRFMWDSETNVISRAYLNGASTTDFLLLEAKGDSLKNIDGTAIAGAGTVGSIKFRDMGNWIYQKEVQALPGTRVRLTSNYRFGSPATDHIQYFKGESGEWDAAHGANTDEIIGGTTNSLERLRLVYDFKTNHLTSAWLPPTSAIDEEKSINADMLLIRRGQNAAQQLTFGVEGKIANVKTIVGAMEFVKDSIVGRVSHFNGDVIGASGNRANRELMHYISFPFDVAVNDIYGFGQLNKEWYLQYYDGAERASKGFFRGDGTTTFWKYMTLADTLRANVGYSLLLDNDYFNTTGEGTVWHNTISDSIYLYFPSAKELSADSVIKSGTKTIRVPEHKHTSGRTFEVDSKTLCHDFTDSDWNMMGVPLFQNQTGLEAHFGYVADPTDWPAEGKGYFYEWDSISNNFEIHTAVGYTFKSMHGYMVQYSGEVSFTGASIQPASSVVARRAQKSRENYTMELQLLKENKRTSRTYIELREEACDTFALDEDVYMVYTSHPADLYTYAGNYDVSANVLSMDNHSIPVGIEVHKAGEYTFTMPSSFNGAATLIDTQTGARTNLALGDYTVSLPKGVCDGRFFIELDLNKMPTAIDGVTDGSGSLRDGNAHKFIENGIMYILRDGILYDARGNKVK